MKIYLLFPTCVFRGGLLFSLLLCLAYWYGCFMCRKIGWIWLNERRKKLQSLALHAQTVEEFKWEHIGTYISVALLIFTDQMEASSWASALVRDSFKNYVRLRERIVLCSIDPSSMDYTNFSHTHAQTYTHTFCHYDSTVTDFYIICLDTGHVVVVQKLILLSRTCSCHNLLHIDSHSWTCKMTIKVIGSKPYVQSRLWKSMKKTKVPNR